MSLLYDGIVSLCPTECPSFVELCCFSGFIRLLFQQQCLNLFLLLAEIFLLKPEHIDILEVEIECVVILHLINLTLGSLFQFVMFLFSLLDQLVDIDFRLSSCLGLYLGILLFHD